MYELSAGQQNVAVVKRCTLVEVRLYYLAMILCVNDEYSSMTLIALRKKLWLSFLNYNLLKPLSRQVSGEDLIGLVQMIAECDDSVQVYNTSKCILYYK